ncbi:hypothetical protein D9V29_06990 [Mycetocola manganoxydans]|uniref:Uncharacterized protein n=1 Tax=Mycetocola manganoxydans TaxID=699879 RepID=A0A3L6ZUX1_9MICO|nr:hypothetical protein [Mycetocola manganoxydans]RLP71598.1 hypothetical protein D9V29_06990 [Mycetocola manganoxydans]GHD38662.1 hypothetical protein GCM10008097_00370 [Mycetocola manganoxydans]
MILRRVFRSWMFIAAVVLPIWPLIGWGIFGGGGWEFLVLIISMPVLFIAMLTVAGLIWARPTVRREKAVSWYDVGALTLWQASVIGFGLFGPASNAFAVLGVLAGIATFWLVLWEFFTDAKKRARETLAEFEQMAARPTLRPNRPRGDAEEIIVIQETRDRPGQ